VSGIIIGTASTLVIIVSTTEVWVDSYWNIEKGEINIAKEGVSNPLVFI
jgi:hypothetical protein